MNYKESKVDPYQNHYVDLQFEREGLFELLQKEFRPIEVLYPGCSFHITPAFYFPHTIFVDQDPAAAAYFSNIKPIREFISRRRHYRRKSYIQFIAQDFLEPLPVRENQFDLVLALYTGGVSKACKGYLKSGGFILTNNHHQDALEASQDHDLALSALIRKRQGKYSLEEQDPALALEVESRKRQSKRYLQQTSCGYEYVDLESYYVFKRIS